MGGWGKYGSSVSNEYISGLVKTVFSHPSLGSDANPPNNVEIFGLFVTSYADLRDLVTPAAPWVVTQLEGVKKAAFWMFWPSEWVDTGDRDFSCYIERHSLFNAMRACEAAGIRSGFPHLADLYELITSKTWMATLCDRPQMHLPAAVIVKKE